MRVVWLASAIAVLLLAGLPSASAEAARTPKWACVQACSEGMDACRAASNGKRARARCRRALMRACRRDGVDQCRAAVTTTTLPASLPCGDLAPTTDALQCGGTCTAGLVCKVGEDRQCGCVPPETVSPCHVSDRSGPFPACGGRCATGTNCQPVKNNPSPFSPATCGCVSTDPNRCGGPVLGCGGTCPAGFRCMSAVPPISCVCVGPIASPSGAFVPD